MERHPRGGCLRDAVQPDSKYAGNSETKSPPPTALIKTVPKMGSYTDPWEVSFSESMCHPRSFSSNTWLGNSWEAQGEQQWGCNRPFTTLVGEGWVWGVQMVCLGSLKMITSTLFCDSIYEAHQIMPVTPQFPELMTHFFKKQKQCSQTTYTIFKYTPSPLEHRLLRHCVLFTAVSPVPTTLFGT